MYTQGKWQYIYIIMCIQIACIQNVHVYTYMYTQGKWQYIYTIMCIQIYMCTHMVCCHTLSLVVWVAHMTSLSLSLCLSLSLTLSLSLYLSLSLSLSAGILTMRCGISGTAQRSWNQSDWQALSGFTHWGSRCVCVCVCVGVWVCGCLIIWYIHMYIYM